MAAPGGYFRSMVAQIQGRELEAMMARGDPLCLIDVREPWEHARAALQPSLLIPLDQLASRAQEIDVPEGALVVTYCHHGIRSLKAAAVLEQLGIAPVASLAGGIDRWSVEIDPRLPRY
jgi:adenylyltransferase/sulfurtransferase